MNINERIKKLQKTNKQREEMYKKYIEPLEETIPEIIRPVINRTRRKYIRPIDKKIEKNYAIVESTLENKMVVLSNGQEKIEGRIVIVSMFFTRNGFDFIANCRPEKSQELVNIFDKIDEGWRIERIRKPTGEEERNYWSWYRSTS